MATDEAERYRQQGNDAFSTKDWERAVELYQRSIEHGGGKNSAKTYSNLAVTYCKLSRFDEATHAAERATAADPTWAKAWYRRGKVSELQKFFIEAQKYYSIAQDLEPSEKEYSKSLQMINKRLKAGIGTQVTRDELKQEPFFVAMRQYLQAGSNVAYLAAQKTFPTSEQWLVQGITEWSHGLRNIVAHFTVQTVPEASALYDEIQAQNIPQEAKAQQTRRLLGGVVDSKDGLQILTSGLACLGGIHVVLETGGSSPDNHGRESLLFCPQPSFLSRVPTFQNLALLFAIELENTAAVMFFGDDMPTSEALLGASKTFYTNIGQNNTPPTRGKPASPEACVEFIKSRLEAGATWDIRLRTYVSLQYRGTILYATIIRLFGMVAEAYRFQQWARKFIDLADEEFQVTKQKAYAEKGATFRQTFRIGMLMSELQSLSVLRGDTINGKYSMEMSFDLCMDIIEVALAMEPFTMPGDDSTMTMDNYLRIQHDVAYRRKPLALAHSAIASHLNILQGVFGLEEFEQIAAHHGLIEEEDGSTDPFALIAKHYQLAALNELSDAEHCAVYWWGYAANMAQAKADSGFTLGDLRGAIAKAEKAERERDVRLFGLNPERGGTFETIAKLTAEHFNDKADSFALPLVLLDRPSQTEARLVVGDQVICYDFRQCEQRSLEIHLNRKGVQQQAAFDTSALYKEFGPDFNVPSLETLCVRELHKAGCEFAIGETDGAVIASKSAMIAARNESSSH